MNDKHILLVEDDETLQALIEKLLVNNDYVVSKAINIQEAKKLIKLFLFDLIILDVMLPDISGLNFYENTIKNRIDTPVIFLSALIFVSKSLICAMYLSSFNISALVCKRPSGLL